MARTKHRETRRATYQDVLDAPPHKVAEVIVSTLHTHPRPAARHAWASSRLGSRLDGPFNPGSGGPGGWWIVFEPELHLGADIVVPDLAGWRRETMAEYPDTAYFTVAPDQGLRGALALHAAAGPRRKAGSIRPRERLPSLVRRSRCTDARGLRIAREAVAAAGDAR